MRSPGIRGISFAAVAVAISATGFHFAQDGTRPADRTGTAAAPEDPLARDLARCRTIGLAAEDDADCAAAWAESRHRFFDYSRLSPDQGAR